MSQKIISVMLYRKVLIPILEILCNAFNSFEFLGSYLFLIQLLCIADVDARSRRLAEVAVELVLYPSNLNPFAEGAEAVAESMTPTA